MAETEWTAITPKSSTTEDGWSPVTPKLNVGKTPSSPETKEKIAKIAEASGEFLFGIPNKEDFSLTEAGVTGGFGAGIMAAGPKVLQTGGKLVGMIPTPATKIIGKGTQALGTALGQIPLSKRLQMGFGGGVAGSTTEQVGEMMGVPRVVTIPVGFLTSGVGGKAVDVVSKAIGLDAGKLSNELRQYGTKKIVDQLTKAGWAKSEAENQVDVANKALKQLAERELIATERAGSQVTSPMASERQIVLDKVNSAKVRAIDAAKQAGLDEQRANQLVQEAQNGVIQSEQAVNQLQQQMLSMPTIDKEKFGTLLRNTTQKLFTDLNKIRKDTSNINEVIANAGNYLRVPTNNIQATIDTSLKGIRNPSLESILIKVKDLATTLDKNGQPINGLTVKSADSLKGYLDSIINAKQFGETKLDKETLLVIKDIKKKLVANITDNYKPYQEAMAKFRVLSRPLDIVERNGALAKTLDIDPISLDYIMTEAQVVGHVIEKSKAGNKVFSRLLEENESIKDSAKLYFTKELFGKDIAPTEAVLANFLKTNETPLKQLGLYDSFKNLRIAKQTAQDAVNDAKGLVVTRKETAKGFAETTEAAESEKKRLISLSGTAGKRLEDSLNVGEPLERTLARSAARAKPGETKIGQFKESAQKTIKQQTDIENDLKILENLLSGPQKLNKREVPKKVEDFAKKLLDKNAITFEEANQIINDARKNTDQWADVSKARNQLYKLGLGLVAAPAAFKFYESSPYSNK